MAFFIYTFMTNDEFKENIRGILIELSEKKLIKFFIQKNYIRIFSFYIDISDYLLTLYDFLDMNGFTDLEFESYSANDEYKKVKISDIKNAMISIFIVLEIKSINVNFCCNKHILSIYSVFF